MRIMLTSYTIGFGQANPITMSGISETFRLLPPLNIRSSINEFVPEYSLLVLCDKLVLDRLSYERLTNESETMLKTAGKTMKLLRNEGFLDVVDYAALLHDNTNLLTKMTENDLRSVDQWTEALSSSLETWYRFVQAAEPKIGMERAAQYYLHGHRSEDVIRILLLLDSPGWGRLDEWERHYVRESLELYLTYVNANIILSNVLSAGLHDWDDFLPFYRQKFLTVGQEDLSTSAAARASDQLFDLAFPEFSITSPEHLIRLLEHRRVGELRTLIDDASRGSVAFDKDFARSVFREVFGTEQRLGRQRRLLGYLTLPISFIPLVGNFAQPLLQEAIGTLLENRLKKPYRWFYMLSDLAEKEATR